MFVVKIIRVDEIERLCHCGGMPTAVCNTIQYNNFYLNTINVLSVAACGVVYDSRLINYYTKRLLLNDY